MENFRFIDGFEDYMVSDLGNVISLKFGKRKLIKQHNNGKGYLGVGLTLNGITKRFLVHRLVASAFLNNNANLPEVNHIDENKSNNKLDNLEWVTHQENISHSSGIRLITNQIIQKNIKNEIIAVWRSIHDACACGFSVLAISECLKNPGKSYNNFMWSILTDEDLLINQHFIDMREAKLFVNN